MNDTNRVEPWLFPVELCEGESLSHFLGKFRRRNHLSPSALGDLAGIGGVIARWERFHLNPFPKDSELNSLAEVIGIEKQRLLEMLPAKGMGIKCEPIRMCGACYAENPYLRLEWQYKSVWKCDRHKLKLISKCPNCRARFKSPALWEFGCCHRCRLPLTAIAEYQKPV